MNEINKDETKKKVKLTRLIPTLEDSILLWEVGYRFDSLIYHVKSSDIWNIVVDTYEIIPKKYKLGSEAFPAPTVQELWEEQNFSCVRQIGKWFLMPPEIELRSEDELNAKIESLLCLAHYSN